VTNYRGIPPSCLPLVLKSDSLFTSCKVQNAVRIFGEPYFFLCTMINNKTFIKYHHLVEPTGSFQTVCEKLPPIKEEE
jgi:hypothetical protein